MNNRKHATTSTASMPPPVAAVRPDEQLQHEIERHGRRELLGLIQRSARMALAKMVDEPKHLNTVGRRYLDQVSELLQRAASAKSWSNDELIAFAHEVAWAKLLTDADVIYRRASGSGTSDVTCVTACAQEYAQCLNENGCDANAWVCLCCVPCSLQYMGCVASCSLPGAGRGIMML